MWQSDVVAFLVHCKGRGWDWDIAWSKALREYPPRGTGFGNGRAQLSFEEDGEPGVVEFFKQACFDAWHGIRPELAQLSTDLMDGEPRFSFGSQTVGDHAMY
jgi:hypothetical protein